MLFPPFLAAGPWLHLNSRAECWSDAALCHSAHWLSYLPIYHSWIGTSLAWNLLSDFARVTWDAWCCNCWAFRNGRSIANEFRVILTYANTQCDSWLCLTSFHCLLKYSAAAHISMYIQCHLSIYLSIKTEKKLIYLIYKLYKYCLRKLIQHWFLMLFLSASPTLNTLNGLLFDLKKNASVC